MEKEIESFKVYADTRIFRKDGNLSRGALWEISNLGNVRRNGDAYIPYESVGGYLEFGHAYYVHRAVAELFLSNTENKPTVDHINRNRHDNRVCNLRWATYQEQTDNKDWESIRMKLSASLKGKKLSEEHRVKISAALLGNKHSLGYKHSEETRAKLRAKVWVFNPTTEHSTRVNSSQLTDYLTKGYISGRKNEGSLGKVWIFNPTTEHSTYVYPSKLNDYLEKGYVRGREKKVWVFNPTTEHLTNINPSQLNDYFAKGYVRGRGSKIGGTIGKVWVTNPTTEQSTLVNPSQLPEYLAKGYIKGRKGKRHSEETKAKIGATKLGNKYTLGKVWVTNPTTAHSTMVNPLQLPDYLDKGYVRGRKIKK